MRLPSKAAVFAVSAIAFIPSLAIGQEVLRGQQAFGDWTQDAPGVVRHFTVEDLPEPGATRSTTNRARRAPSAQPGTPLVPEGFKAERIASGIANPRTIRVAPNGDVFVANMQANEVLVFRLQEGSAKVVEQKVFANDKLNVPYGIAFYPPGDNPEWVYVANINGLVRFPYRSGDLEARGAAEVLVEGIPEGGHWTRDIAFSPDGETLYYSVGSQSNVAEELGAMPQDWAGAHTLGAAWGSEERRANVLAFDAQGGNERVFATGLRNCSGMTIQPATSELWCVVNERDALGDNLPFDYATSVKDGAYYGWPWYYIGDHEDPRLAGIRPDLKGKATVPDVLIAPHSAPLNIAFYEGNMFPAEYKGDAFVALHGSWNRSTRTGYKVVRLKFDETGKPTGEYEDFMTGFVVNEDEVWGRPVGVAVAKDGALLVTEDQGGSIWRVSYGE